MPNARPERSGRAFVCVLRRAVPAAAVPQRFLVTITFALLPLMLFVPT
jgi:hypothetical protein